MDTISMYAKSYLPMGATKEEITRPSSLGTKCSALQTKKIQIHNLLLYNIQALGSSPKHHPGALLWLFGWLLPAQSGFPGILSFTVVPTTGVPPSKHLHSPPIWLQVHAVSSGIPSLFCIKGNTGVLENDALLLNIAGKQGRAVQGTHEGRL